MVKTPYFLDQYYIGPLGFWMQSSVTRRHTEFYMHAEDREISIYYYIYSGTSLKQTLSLLVYQLTTSLPEGVADSGTGVE